MSNRIKIKRGPGIPANGTLRAGELGFDTTNRELYIGTDDTDNSVAEKIGLGSDLPIPLTIEKGGTNAESPQEARENLGFTYGDMAPTETPITGEGSVYFMNEASEIPLPIPEGGTGAMNTQGAIENLGMYPIGAQYVTSTNTNPSAWLGGSWELVDKYLKRTYYSSNEKADIITLGSSTSSANVTIIVDGHSVIIKCYATFTGAFLDTNRTALTINYDKIGITRITEAVIGHGGSDDGNAVVIGSLAYTSGNVVYAQAVTVDGSSIPADTEIHLTFNANVGKNYILDEFCDKFYWQRIA